MFQATGHPPVPPWFDLYWRWLYRVGGFLAAAYFWLALRRAHRAARTLITAGRLTEEEREEFVRPVAIYIGAVWFLPQLIYLLRGAPPVPFQPYTRTNLLASAVLLGVPLLWLWIGRGAELTAKMGPALAPNVNEAKWTPGRVRFFATLFVGACALVGVLNNLRAL